MVISALILASMGSAIPAAAQLNTRLLLSSGTEVPGHSGLGFGPFLSVAMNGRQEIAFLTTLRSPRTEIRAVVRSSGVSFSVVAFQGLLGPYLFSTYDSFSPPSINDSGVVAFSATLATSKADIPKALVAKEEGGKLRTVVTTLDSPPGQPEAKFEEFSAPLVVSDGSVLFAARWTGKGEGTGLFLASARGLQALPLPAGMQLGAQDLLEPFFFGHDEAAFLRRGVAPEAATEQFFRAVAIQSFEELQPPPTRTGELLAARPDAQPLQMLVVYLENGALQTALLAGDPTKPVIVKQGPGDRAVKLVGKIAGLTIGPHGNLIFAAAPADTPTDLALFCDCEGQVDRLSTSVDFLPITTTGSEKPLLSLTGDTQQTTAFIAPTLSGDNTAIYVTTIH